MSNDRLFDYSNDVTDIGTKNNLESDFADDEVSDDDDDEDNLSFDSNITDVTWKADLSDDENEDFASLDTTPTNDFKEIVSIVDNIGAVDSFDEMASMPSPLQPVVRKRGRPPGSKNSSRGGTPSSLSPSVHKYNLRQRKQNQTFNGFGTNPILDVESPDTFGKVVASLARQTKVLNRLYTEKFRYVTQKY